MIDEKHKADHLFLLVGTNPLPNYVATKLLWRDTSEDAKIYFVYSTDTDAAREALQTTLGFASEDEHIQNVKVEEANPDHIHNTIIEIAKNLSGKVGLNYTGGTKVMAVHAYLALQELEKLKVQYSYLDARKLQMIIQGAGIEKIDTPMVGLDIEGLTVDTILGLHGYRGPSLKREPICRDVARALARAHRTYQLQEIWQSWVRRSFLREPKWPEGVGESPQERDDFWKNWSRDVLLYHRPPPHKQRFNARDWKTKKELQATPFELPGEPDEIAEVDACIRQAAGKRNLVTLDDVRQAIGIKDADDLGKWFEGGWLETYVFEQVQQLKKDDSAMQYHIGDIVRDIQAKREVKLEVKPPDGDDTRLKQELQLDVAFLRGYQLFVLSCTTALDKSLCKSKLLEAAVRAEQIGGAEARVGLVCCFDNSHELEKEIVDVLGKRVKVFCRSDLERLKDHIADWIASVSPRE